MKQLMQDKVPAGKGNRRIILYGAELLVLLTLVLCGLFWKKECVLEASKETVSGSWTSESLSLAPGIYQVRVQSDIPEGTAVYLGVNGDPAGDFRSLLQNTVVMLGEQKELTFTFWITSRAEQVQLTAALAGTKDPMTLDVAVYRTGKIFYILAVLCLLVFSAADLLLVLYRLVREKKITAEQQAAVWVLIGCVVLSSVPYLTDYISIGADTTFQLTRIEGLTQTILEGNQFPVRVQSYWLYGHGYAVSTFYGDMFLLPAVLLRLCGFPMVTAYQFLIYTINTVTALVAWFSFRRCSESRLSALLGTVLYVLAPYRIYNLYNRGAVGEAWGMAWFPLIFCGLYLLLTERTEGRTYRRYKYCLIAGFTCLLHSHLISMEIALLGTAFVCLICYKRTFRRQTVLELFKGAGITLAVNCWFWLPLAQMMLKGGYLFTEILEEQLQERGAELSAIFQMTPYMGDGQYNAQPPHVGAACLAMLLIFLVWVWNHKKEKKAFRGICGLLFGLIWLCVFMSSRYFPWDGLLNVPVLGEVLGAIQNPTRMIAPAAALCAFFACFFVKQLEPGTGKKAAVFLSILALGTAVFQVNDITYNLTPVYLYETQNIGSAGVNRGEYLLEGTSVFDYYYHGPVAEEGLTWHDYEKNGTEIYITVENPTGAELSLELPLISYPGYAVREITEKGDEGTPYISETSGSHGDIRLCIPAGFSGSLRISYEGLASFRAAEGISLISILLLAAVPLIKRRRKTGE